MRRHIKPPGCVAADELRSSSTPVRGDATRVIRLQQLHESVSALLEGNLRAFDGVEVFLPGVVAIADPGATLALELGERLARLRELALGEGDAEVLVEAARTSDTRERYGVLWGRPLRPPCTRPTWSIHRHAR